MAIEFRLPDIGEGIAEGEIVKWLVKVGDSVQEHQSIVEVMTDKATVEVPSPSAGRIAEIRAKEGEVVPVGKVIFVLDAGAGSPTNAARAPAPSASAPPPTPAPSVSSTRAPASPAPAPAFAGPKVAARPASTSSGATGTIIDFKLPDIGEGIAEGEIVKWLVQVGDQVKEHQSIVEVMTDKATVEVPAPAAGRITRLLANAGEVVPVGKVIFSLTTAAAPAPATPAAAPATPTVAAPTREAALAGVAGSAASARAPSVSRADDKVLAVPSARRVARDLGIDIAQVPGSGRGGIVRRSDVEMFASLVSAATTASTPTSLPSLGARPATPLAPIAFAPGARETRAPFRGVRRKIAEAMTRSKHTAAHFTVIEEVDVADLVKLREEAKTIGADSNVKVTFMPFIMKATALGLAKFPELNGHLDEATQEIVTYGFVNLGIAIDTPSGLIVPVVKEVQSKGVLQLAAELAEIADRTRAGKVKPEELKGSTFSITNAGNIGGIFATPIINFPDIAILGVHRIVKRPGVVETPQGDKIEVRQYMHFSCSVDHRLADGASAARFLVYLKKLLENPGLLAL
jgi:pyruvate dehydrogenase E2 component (dihydrolipoamide acetyltransferase)